MAFQVCSDTNLPACCPLSHLLRKCQLSQGESREAGANCTPDASGELLRRLVRVLLLPSRLAPCHLPQGGRLWFSAQSKLVSPSGRDVAQRQRGLAPSLRELDLPQAKPEGVLQIGKIRMRFALIRTLSYPKRPSGFSAGGSFFVLLLSYYVPKYEKCI